MVMPSSTYGPMIAWGLSNQRRTGLTRKYPNHQGQTRCDMTEFIEQIKRVGGRIGVFPIGENAWIDTGEWGEYRKALDSLGRLDTRGIIEG